MPGGFGALLLRPDALPGANPPLFLGLGSAQWCAELHTTEAEEMRMRRKTANMNVKNFSVHILSCDIEISSDDSKILINSIKLRPSTKKWMNEKSLRSTLSHDKASNTMEKQRPQFSYKD